MTEKDWKLLEKAHSLNAVDNQLVEKMIPMADTEDCRELLRVHESYLRHMEEHNAGVL